ncbi:MAG: hypothetical protein H0U76_12615 [Ktedonobacteraceae bacterium]|nr:hypothetical protein [Ktedonobacteraceae bacterium]
MSEGHAFALNSEERPNLFAKGALKIESFKIFIEMLEAFGDPPRTLPQLAVALREKLGTDWKDGTAEVNTKIMLDWARHTGLAPSSYIRDQTGRAKKGQPVALYTTASLFSNIVDMD